MISTYTLSLIYMENAKMNKKCCFLLACCFMSTAGVAVVRSREVKAEDLTDVQNRIRRSLVYLELNAQTANGVPLQSHGTGFIIDKDGRILTTYHLLSSVEKAAAAGHQGALLPDSITISAHLMSKGAQSYTADVVTRKQDRDLLVLRIPSSGSEDYSDVCVRADWRSERLKQPIVTAGFPDALPYVTGRGVVASNDGPNGTWITDMAFNPGQSGSPVFTEKGEVVGVAKGQIVDGRGVPLPGAYVVIPIADALSVAPTMAICKSAETVTLETANASSGLIGSWIRQGSGDRLDISRNGDVNISFSGQNSIFNGMGALERSITAGANLCVQGPRVPCAWHYTFTEQKLNMQFRDGLQPPCDEVSGDYTRINP